MIILDEKHVYVVLECHGEHDEKIHGVFTTREIADKVAEKIRSKTGRGYVCVLKQKVKGPSWNFIIIRRNKNV